MWSSESNFNIADVGSDIAEKVILGQAQWSDLFAKHDFFHKYKYYLQVIASTGNADLQIKWSVVSKKERAADFH